MTLEELSKPVIPGTKVKLKKSTYYLNKGAEVEIVGFMDGDPNKVIVKECQVGGWISPDKLKTDIAPFRLKTFSEILISCDNPLDKLSTLNGNVAKLIRQREAVSDTEGFALQAADGTHYLVGSYLKKQMNAAVDIDLLYPINAPYFDGLIKLKFSDQLNFVRITLSDLTSDQLNQVKPRLISELNKMYDFKSPSSFEAFIYNNVQNGGSFVALLKNIPYEKNTYTFSIGLNFNHFDFYKDNEVIYPASLFTASCSIASGKG